MSRRAHDVRRRLVLDRLKHWGENGFIKVNTAPEGVRTVNEMTGVVLGREGQDKVSARWESIHAAVC